MRKESFTSVGALLQVTMVACAVVLTALAVRRELFSLKSDLLEPHVVADSLIRIPTSAWESAIATGGVRGPDTALMTLVEFSDFQCPFCQRLAKVTLPAVERRFPSMRFVYRHWPLPIHPYAMGAARAAVCAGAQGGFWQMHGALIRSAAAISSLPPAQLAQLVGLTDTRSFEECMRGAYADTIIARDVALSQRIGATGTPTILINGTLVRGRRDSLRLIRIIDSLYRSQEER